MLKLFDPIRGFTFLSIALRVLFTCISAGLIGYERGLEGRAAGFRTHILVALGACIVMCVDQYLVTMINPNADPARLGAQVINGIGFLGAGTIIFQKNVVRGLTTAAGLWVTAAIGLACGSGMYAAALIVTVLVIVGLEVLILFIPHVGRMVVELSFTTTSETSIKSITDSLKKIDIKVSSFKLCKMQSAQGEKVYRVDLELRVKRRDGHAKLIDMVSEYDNVTISSVE